MREAGFSEKFDPYCFHSTEPHRHKMKVLIEIERNTERQVYAIQRLVNALEAQTAMLEKVLLKLGEK